MPVVLGMASAITSRRVATYGVASTVAAVAVVLNAFRQRSNFYSAAVMLGGSNGCMMVLFNFGVFLTLCFGKVAQHIFFGPLRSVEIEHLHERLWYAITESLLAMTIFRDDFDSSFALLFGTMLFLKVFHWLAQDRIEFMEQSQSVSRLFHVRMIALLSLLFELDLFFATFAIEVLLVDQNRKGIMIMFASEFFILTATLWATIAKYLINCQDMRSEEPWEAKSMYVFFVDLATDFLKLVTYLACFGLILSYYGLPLNIIRDVYMTGRSFFGRLYDFVKYRAATKNMDTRFPDATPTDLTSMSDGTCIICREEMVARGAERSDQQEEQQQRPQTGLNETPKKLPCGHIFHFHCLRSWLERQQSCPTCRRTVFTTPETNAAAANDGQPVGDLAENVRGPGAAPAQGSADAGHAPAPSDIGSSARPGSANNNIASAQEIAATARERMQTLVQQLQRANVDRQSGNGQQTSVQAQAGGSSSSRQLQSTDPSEQAGEAKRRLIASLFGAREDMEAQSSRAWHGNDVVASSSLADKTRDTGVTNGPADLNALNYLRPSLANIRKSLKKDNSIQSPRDGISRATADAGPSTAPSERETGTGETSASPPVDSADAEESRSDPADAREAARLAALKRFANQRRSEKTTIRRPTSVSDGKGQDGIASAPTNAATKSLPLANEPRLIPLFNVDSIEGFASDIASQLPFPLAMQSAQSRSSASTHSSGLHASTNSPGNMAVLSSLSTQELRNLSSQTREGLEERLRLLYRVEGSIHGLVEELTRALSAIPAEDEVKAQSEDDTHGSGDCAGAPSVSEDADVKGKAPAEGLHAAESTSRYADPLILEKSRRED